MLVQTCKRCKNSGMLCVKLRNRTLGTVDAVVDCPNCENGTRTPYIDRICIHHRGPIEFIEERPFRDNTERN